MTAFFFFLNQYCSVCIFVAEMDIKPKGFWKMAGWPLRTRACLSLWDKEVNKMLCCALFREVAPLKLSWRAATSPVCKLFTRKSLYCSTIHSELASLFMSAQIEKWVLELCGELVQVTGFSFFQVRSKDILFSFSFLKGKTLQSIHLCLIQFRVVGACPMSWGERWGSLWTGPRSYGRVNLGLPVNLTCMTLECGRKREYLERTHTATWIFQVLPTVRRQC